MRNDTERPCAWKRIVVSNFRRSPSVFSQSRECARILPLAEIRDYSQAGAFSREPGILAAATNTTLDQAPGNPIVGPRWSDPNRRKCRGLQWVTGQKSYRRNGLKLSTWFDFSKILTITDWSHMLSWGSPPIRVDLCSDTNFSMAGITSLYSGSEGLFIKRNIYMNVCTGELK